MDILFEMVTKNVIPYCFETVASNSSENMGVFRNSGKI